MRVGEQGVGGGRNSKKREQIGFPIPLVVDEVGPDDLIFHAPREEKKVERSS